MDVVGIGVSERDIIWQPSDLHGVRTVPDEFIGHHDGPVQAQSLSCNGRAEDNAPALPHRAPDLKDQEPQENFGKPQLLWQMGDICPSLASSCWKIWGSLRWRSRPSLIITSHHIAAAHFLNHFIPLDLTISYGSETAQFNSLLY